MNISPTSDLLFFDSFGIAGLKKFIVKYNKKIIDKVLKGIEKMDRVDPELTLQRLKFSMQGYKKLTNNKLLLLSETARDFFHLLKSFGKKKNRKKIVTVWLLEDPIQKMETSPCGALQLYFYKNLFFPDKNSKLHSYKKLANLATETLLNELFPLDQDKNKQIINKYINERQMIMI